MFNPPRKMMLVSLLCAVIFFAGMVQLFLLRFEAGNVYPAYSSLRSDPLGSRALYESLHRVVGGSVTRNFRDLGQVGMKTGKTLMIIGIKERSFHWQRSKYEKLLENTAQNGGRLVLAFTASSAFRSESRDENGDSKPVRKETESKKAPPVENSVAPEKTDEDNGDCSSKLFAGGLHGLGFRFSGPQVDAWEEGAVRYAKEDGPLPSNITWRSPLSFELIHNSWDTLYEWQDQPVVVQRPWGKGTVVMLSDSYLLSNEALRNHRFVGLLAWLAVPANDVIFDEFDKGLVKQPGMAGLARKYRLHGVFAALLVVVCLFIWRQSTLFIAPMEDQGVSFKDQPAAGRDTSMGLVHLARQHIDAKSLLTVCFEAWKTQGAQRVPEPRVAEVETMVLRAASDPRKEIQVKTYKEICELLKQGKRS